jgi:hypothetical protein
MKRGRKPSTLNGGGAAPSNGNGTLVKSTYLLPLVLKQNLAYLALERGKDQSDIVREAISEHLREHQYDPVKPPLENIERKLRGMKVAR